MRCADVFDRDEPPRPVRGDRADRRRRHGRSCTRAATHGSSGRSQSRCLPSELAGDPQFRDRFDREAKTISALNHPNICTLYDVGEAVSPAAKGAFGSTLRYLVLEFLEGETLAARLEKGALPLPEALRIGLDIINALEAAHRHGIVHRDLKPGNVMSTKSGAKLLDFGLAKSSPLVAGVSPMAPTLSAGTAPLTDGARFRNVPGHGAGTAGRSRRRRAHGYLFAFGAMLYEMITGRRAFTGKTQASLVGAILKDDPPPVSQTQAVAPPALDHLVRTCLSKDPDARYQTAHDVKIQLAWIAQGGSGVGLPAPDRRQAALAGTRGVVDCGGPRRDRHRRRDSRHRSPARSAAFGRTRRVDHPSPRRCRGDLAGFAVSPDGRHVVFSTNPLTRERPLWIRSLASQIARPLRGTRGWGVCVLVRRQPLRRLLCRRQAENDRRQRRGTAIQLCDLEARPAAAPGTATT